jgi:hypothetical protein
MTQPTAATTKYFYDDDQGQAKDITPFVLTINDIDVKNILQNVTPFGVKMPVHSPTGQGELAPIDVGGLYKTGNDSVDELFGDRVPEDPDAATRTFMIEWEPDRTTSVETHLINFKRSPNRDNGLTRWSSSLQPTGDVTENFPT